MKQYNFDEIIDRSNTDCVKYDFTKPFFKTDDILPMWVADMDFKTPDFIIDAIKERLNHEILGYTVRTESFNDAISAWMLKQHGWKIEKEWVSFSPGVVPALNMLVMALTEPGDKIMVQPPVYFPFFYAIENNKRIKVDNPLTLKNGRLAMDFDDMRKKIKGVKMLLLCHPHNPGGSVWTKEELKTLAEICIEEKVLVVSDEIHSDLVFKPHKHIPLASVSEGIAAQTITCNAPSKTFNIAGLATSYLIITNKEILDKYNYVLNDQVHVNMGNIFGAIALRAAYSKGSDWLSQLLDYVWGNVIFAKDFIDENIPGIRPIVPESTYMMWLDCSGLGLSGDRLPAFFIKNAKLGLNDGRIFGQGGDGFMRLNLACPRAIVVKALTQLKGALSS